MLIGYARVSTEDQSNRSQSDELWAFGCDLVREEFGSGGSRDRPILNQIIAEAVAGDTIVVVRIDRLARSLSHLLEVIEGLEARGVHFRSLRDPIDTSSPQGKFTLQVLGAAAELERALIRERTIAGLRAAKSKGRIGGNPGLSVKDPETIKKIRMARDDRYLKGLLETAGQWAPAVRLMRPLSPWEDVLAVINVDLAEGQRWTMRRLLRAAHRYVEEGLLPVSTIGVATRKTEDRLTAIVAALKEGHPEMGLAEIGRLLERMRERTPRGSAKWGPSSVKLQLDRAVSLGLLHVPKTDEQ